MARNSHAVSTAIAEVTHASNNHAIGAREQTQHTLIAEEAHSQTHRESRPRKKKKKKKKADIAVN